MSKSPLFTAPFRVEYDNDTGSQDDYFHEFWVIYDAKSEKVGEFDSEAKAQFIVNLLNRAS